MFVVTMVFFLLTLAAFSLSTHAQSNPRDPNYPASQTQPQFQVIDDAPYQVIPALPPLYPKGESLKDLGFDSKEALLIGIDEASTVDSIAFSPNGRYIASGSWDNTVRLWDLDKKQLVHAFKGHESSVSSVAFSPNGRYIASGSWDNTVCLWDLDKKQLVHAFKGHYADVESVAFSSNGRFIASGSRDQTVRLWDVEKKTLTHSFEGHYGHVVSVAFSPENPCRYIISGSSDDTIRLWDVEKKQLVHTFNNSFVSSVTFSPNGRYIALGTWDSVGVWDVESKHFFSTVEDHPAHVKSVAFSPDGCYIASGSSDNTIRLWDFVNMTELLLFRGERDNNWLTIDHSVSVLRGEDGTWIRQLPNGRQGPVFPSHMEIKDDFSFEIDLDSTVLTPEGNFEVQISITNHGKAPAYWLHLDTIGIGTQTVKPKMLNSSFSLYGKGEQLWKPQRIARLAPEETGTFCTRVTHLLSQFSGFFSSRKHDLKVTVTSANGTSVTQSIPVTVLSPNLIWTTAELNKGDSTLKALFKNTGKAPLAPSTVALHFKPKDKALDKTKEPISNSRQSLPTIKPGGTHQIAFVLPEEYHDQLENLVLVGANDAFPLFEWALSPKEIIRNIAWLYWTISAVLLAGLLIGTYFFRRYRHPLVVRLSANPQALLVLPPEKLADARMRLLRTDRLDAVLSTTQVSKERFEESVEFFASLGDNEKISLVAKRLNATLMPADEPLGRLAELSLPAQFPLNLQKCFVYLPNKADDAAHVFETLRQIAKTRLQPTVIVGKDSEFQQTLQQITLDRTNKWVAPTGPELTHLMLGTDAQEVLSQILASQLSLVQLSPYQLGGGVNREAVFFGREETISHIVNRDPANYLLVSGRQLGKSSLLKALQRRYDTDHPDIQCHYITLSNEVLVPRLAKALGLTDKTDLDAIAEAVKASLRHQVFLIDEADAYIRNERQTDYKILGALRRMSEESDAHFILAGFWELYQHAVLDYQSPLRNFGQRIDIGALEEDACYQLATEPMKSMGLTYADDALVKRIISATGRRANLIAIACNEILSKLTPTQRIIEETDVSAALASDELKKAFKGWDALDDDAQSCNIDKLIVYATVQKDSFTLDDIDALLSNHELSIDGKKLEYSLERLELAFVIGKSSGRYTFRVPLLVKMLREESPATKFKMVMQALKQG